MAGRRPEDSGLEHSEAQETTPGRAQEPTVLAGCFELQEVIGGGGMAIVYRAWDRAHRRPCAVKVLADVLSRDEQFRLRFRQEAQAARGLTHPHIVTVYDCGESGPHHYIVMEYVARGTLRELMNREGGLQEATAAKLASEVADALAYAHARGLIHRDIKPQNILLTEDGVAKVADFGIARTLDTTSLTRTGFVMGSAQYLSPEQARGDPAGPCSDLYALGVVLFEMLAGRVPFDGDGAVAIALKHLGEPPPDLRQIRPDVSESSAAVVARLLAKADGDRYPSAAALAVDLRRIAQERRVAESWATPAPSSHVATRQIPQSALETAPLPRAADPHVGSGPAALPATHRDAVRRPIALGRGRWSAGLRKALAGALLAVAVTGAAVWRIAEENGANVPPLVGRTLAAASQAAGAVQLRVVVAGRRQDSNLAAGMILAQDPPPGRRLNKGSSLHVIVSQGTGIVPPLQGLLVAAAASRLEAAGLRLGRTIDSYGLGAETAGQVLYQFHPPGTHLTSNDPVDVIVSKGPIPSSTQSSTP